MNKRLLIIALTFMCSNNSIISQKIWNRMHELYSQELVVTNNIKEVIFQYNDGESQIFKFNADGLLLLEIESKNWHSNDTSHIHYKYLDQQLSEVIHLNKINGDTLSYSKYYYENNRLISISGTLLSNKTNEKYLYDNLGYLTKIESIMYSYDYKEILQKKLKSFDQQGRIIELERDVGGRKDKMEWQYLKNEILINIENRTFENRSAKQIIEFNKDLQITKFINQDDNGEIVSITEMIYDERGLLTEMKMDNTQLLKVDFKYN